MAWTCVCCRTENAAYRRKCSNSECRFPGGAPQAWDEKRGKDKRKDKQYPLKHTWHCGDCGEDNSSRRWFCSSCGAKPQESGASSSVPQPKKRLALTAAKFCRGCGQERDRVQASLPMESRSQPDSEATNVKIDEDSSQDRDKGNSREVANKLKDLDTLIRQLQPCAKDEGVATLLEEKKQERDELKIQLQTHKPLHQRLRLATEARAKASKALEITKRQEADIVELFTPQARGGRSNQGHASAAQQQCRTVGAEISDGDAQCRCSVTANRQVSSDARPRHSRRSSGHTGFVNACNEDAASHVLECLLQRPFERSLESARSSGPLPRHSLRHGPPALVLAEHIRTGAQAGG